MALESVDIEEYSQFYTLPRKVYAKRLTAALNVTHVLHGKTTKIKGEAGDWHVILTTPAGNLSKEAIYTQEEFEKAFGEYSEQLELKFKNAKAKKDDEDDPGDEGAGEIEDDGEGADPDDFEDDGEDEERD